MVLFAAAAVPGSLLIARFGALSGADRRTSGHSARLRIARRVGKYRVALRCQHPHGFRRSGHPAGNAAAGARMDATPDRICHRGLHERLADRRNSADRADDTRRAADGCGKLARKFCRLGDSGCDHRANRGAARAASGDDNFRRAQMVAGLARRIDLAAWPDPRQRQRPLFCIERLHPRLPASGRTRWRNHRRAHRAQSSASCRRRFCCSCSRSGWSSKRGPTSLAGFLGLLSIIGDCIRERNYSGPCSRSAGFCVRRNVDPDARPAAVAQSAGRRSSYRRSNVHHQLHLRRDNSDFERDLLGSDRSSRYRFHSDRPLRRSRNHTGAKDRRPATRDGMTGMRAGASTGPIRWAMGGRVFSLQRAACRTRFNTRAATRQIDG